MSREKYRNARQLPETKRVRGRGFIEEGRGWAFTRRHDDGVSSIWPTEYRSHLRYTPTVCRHRGSTYPQREWERKRTNCQSLSLKTYRTRDPLRRVRFDIRTRLNPLSPERSVCQSLNGEDKRCSSRHRLAYHFHADNYKMVEQTLRLLFTFENRCKTRLRTASRDRYYHVYYSLYYLVKFVLFIKLRGALQ